MLALGLSGRRAARAAVWGVVCSMLVACGASVPGADAEAPDAAREAGGDAVADAVDVRADDVRADDARADDAPVPRPDVSDDAPAERDGGACDPRWTVVAPFAGGDAGPVARATVAEGALRLETIAGVRTLGDLAVRQEGLAGDFDATFEIDVTGSTEDFSGAEAFVESDDGRRFAAAGIVAFGGAFNVSTTMDFIEREASAQYTRSGIGTVRITRAGSRVTVEVTAGDVTLRAATEGAGAATRIGLRLKRMTARAAAARLTRFAITNGGGAVRSDEFDCDTLRR